MEKSYMYIGNLKFVFEKLIETNSKRIWATITPIHPKRPFLESEWSWRNEKTAEYNAKSLDLMKQYNISAALYGRTSMNITENMIHLNAKRN